MIIDLKTIKKVYINLSSNFNRRKEFENAMHQLNYENYERFDAINLPKQRGCFNAGCSASHNTLMKQYKNQVPFLLFEDDAAPTLWYSEYVNSGKIEIPDGADAVYLGYSMAGHDNWFKSEPINDEWLRVTSCMATHAILFLTKQGIEAFINNSDHTIATKQPLDIGYASGVLPNIKVYAPKKAVYYQKNNCVITTNVIVNPEINKWSSYNHDGTLHFDRQIIYDNNDMSR